MRWVFLILSVFGLLSRSGSDQVSSASLRASVMRARSAQGTRFSDDSVKTNAVMAHREVERYCPLDPASETMLRHTMQEFGLSARAHDKICKVARIIADLEGADRITPDGLAEAISYRRLDRKAWVIRPGSARGSLRFALACRRPSDRGVGPRRRGILSVRSAALWSAPGSGPHDGPPGPP